MPIYLYLGHVECNLNTHECHGVVGDMIDVTQVNFDDLIIALNENYFKLEDSSQFREFNEYIEKNWDKLSKEVYWRFNIPLIFPRSAKEWHCCDNGYFHSVEDSIKNLKRDLWGRESFAASSL